MAFGKRVEKQVIVVRDCVGFYTSRILAPYINEAAHILAEGGNEVGARVAKIMFEAYGERMKPEEALAGVVKDGRQGCKNKRGFYTTTAKIKSRWTRRSAFCCLEAPGARPSICRRSSSARSCTCSMRPCTASAKASCPCPGEAARDNRKSND